MAEDIALKSAEAKNDVPLLLEGCGCQLCLEKPAKYTCPRCKVKYCSLDCYKCEKHVNCSELFYKNCVMEALQDDMIDKEGKQKMVEMLKHHHQETQSDDFLDQEGKTDLEERLEGLNLDRDSEKIWEKLTEVEKREFGKAIDNGYIGSLMEMWVPWWINNEQRPSSGDSQEKANSRTMGTSAVPKIVKNVPQLQTLIKSKPASPHTKYNLVNMLYSYVYICRFYNGCHYDFVEEAVEGLWKLSVVLCHNVNFTSVDSALQSSVEASLQHREFFNSEEFSLSVINDVVFLLKGSEHDLESHFVECALSDIYRLITRGVNLNKISDKGKSATHRESDPENRIAKALWLAKKKVYFMLAWFHGNQDVCLSLEPFLPVVKEAIKLEFKQRRDRKTMIENSRICGPFRRKKLIEEI